jgi:hypothetical protein
MSQSEEWSSYLPDGRPIRVRRLGEGWQVSCEERSATGRELAAAMSAAIGLDESGLSLTRSTTAALLRWVAQHSAQIATETR